MSVESRQVVVVTGISGNLGRTLTKLLHRTERIVGLDRRPFPGAPKDVELLPARPPQEEGRGRLPHPRRQGGHPHGDHARPPDVVGGAPLVQRGGHHAGAGLRCAKYGVKKVVVLSSANVYGPSPDNSNFLTEDAPLMAACASRACATSSRSTCSPTASSGGTRTSRRSSSGRCTSWGRASRTRRRTTCGCGTRGCSPASTRWSSSSTRRTRRGRWSRRCGPGCKGVYNVVGPGEVPLSAVLRELGRTPIPVPHPIARPLLGALFRYRLANFPPPELDHIQFLCMVDGSRWRADVGWVPQRLDEGHDSIGRWGAGCGIESRPLGACPASTATRSSWFRRARTHTPRKAPSQPTEITRTSPVAPVLLVKQRM